MVNNRTHALKALVDEDWVKALQGNLHTWMAALPPGTATIQQEMLVVSDEDGFHMIPDVRHLVE